MSSLSPTKSFSLAMQVSSIEEALFVKGKVNENPVAFNSKTFFFSSGINFSSAVKTIAAIYYIYHMKYKSSDSQYLEENYNNEIIHNEGNVVTYKILGRK